VINYQKDEHNDALFVCLLVLFGGFVGSFIHLFEQLILVHLFKEFLLLLEY